MVLTYTDESTGDQGKDQTTIKIDTTDETDEKKRERERKNFEKNLRNKGLKLELEPSAVCLILLLLN